MDEKIRNPHNIPHLRKRITGRKNERDPCETKRMGEQEKTGWCVSAVDGACVYGIYDHIINHII